MVTAYQRKHHIQEAEHLALLNNPLANARFMVHSRLSLHWKEEGALHIEQCMMVIWKSVHSWTAEEVQQFFIEKKAVNVHNCEVKPSHQGHQVEIILKSAI